MPLNERDEELLSAYIDGALTEAERAELDARLTADASLRRELARLQTVVALVNDLPELRAPRSFTLTPDMVRAARPLPRAPARARLLSFAPLVAAAAVALVGAVILFGNIAPASAPGDAPLDVAALPTATPTALDDALRVEPTQRALPTPTVAPTMPPAVQSAPAQGEVIAATASPAPTMQPFATQASPQEGITAATGGVAAATAEGAAADAAEMGRLATDASPTPALLQAITLVPEAAVPMQAESATGAAVVLSPMPFAAQAATAPPAMLAPDSAVPAPSTDALEPLDPFDTAASPSGLVVFALVLLVLRWLGVL